MVLADSAGPYTDLLRLLAQVCCFLFFVFVVVFFFFMLLKTCLVEIQSFGFETGFHYPGLILTGRVAKEE